MAYLDAVQVYGDSKNFSVTIETTEDEGATFSPFDLSNYSVRFRVMGSATLAGTVLLEKIITQNTDIDVEGQITDAENGMFEFCITSADTKKLGLGAHPITIDILDAASLTEIYVLSEGGLTAEFSKLRIVQV